MSSPIFIGLTAIMLTTSSVSHELRVDNIRIYEPEQKAFSSPKSLYINGGATRAYQFNRNHLVNIDHIKEIQRWFNGKLMVLMNDEDTTELSTSRAGAEKLRNILKI